jgi:DNA-binding GntR family transcriptional regulator
MLSGIIDAQTARYQADRVDRGGGRNAPKLHAEHARLLDLIRDGAVDEAQALWRDHLERVRSLVATSEETVLDLYS